MIEKTDLSKFEFEYKIYTLQFCVSSPSLPTCMTIENSNLVNLFHYFIDKCKGGQRNTAVPYSLIKVAKSIKGVLLNLKRKHLQKCTPSM